MKKARIEAIRKLMEQREIDALILIKPINTYYATGFRTISYTRPVIVAIPIAKEAAMILPALNHDEAVASVPEIRNFVTYKDTEIRTGPPRLIESFLRDLGLTKAKVGIEKDFMPVMFYEHLRDRFQNMDFADGSDMIAELRTTKTREEVELIRKASELTDIAMEVSVRKASEGKTEIGLRAMGSYELETKGSEMYPDTKVGILCNINSGPKSANPHEIPSGRKLRPGDLVAHGWLATADGYWTENGRMTVVGKPDKRQKEIFDVVLEAQKKGTEAVKPGVKASEIHKIVEGIITEAGLAKYLLIVRSGHGLGLEYHENPYIHSENTTELKPGMVFSVEPGLFISGFGGISLSDTVVVTDDGHEVLTKYDRELI